MEVLSYSSSQEIDAHGAKRALHSLENGQIVFLPKFSFPVSEEEKSFFSSEIVNKGSKNVSYNSQTEKIGGVTPEYQVNFALLSMLKRYSEKSKELLKGLFPSYHSHAIQGRTSFRPVETEGRTISRKKDDTLLHVDSFPSRPVRGNRILRIFTNVNPFDKPRLWNIGEPFEEVVRKIAPQLSSPLPLSSFFLKFFGITKSQRTLYDHYMLHIHNSMKENVSYQNSVSKSEISFPAQSTWVVFTDQVSHAALSGQFLFEQTFYLPVHALQNPLTSPLKVLEKFLKKKLI